MTETDVSIYSLDNKIRDCTIGDLCNNFDNYYTNGGYLALADWSQEKFAILIDLRQELPGGRVAEIRSGSGRFIGQWCESGVAHLFAVEPSARGLHNNDSWSRMGGNPL